MTSFILLSFILLFDPSSSSPYGGMMDNSGCFTIDGNDKGRSLHTFGFIFIFMG